MPTATHPIVVTLNDTFVRQLTPSKLAFYIRALLEVCQQAPGMSTEDVSARLRERLDRGDVTLPPHAYARTAELLRSTRVDILTVRTQQGRTLYQGQAAAPVFSAASRPVRYRRGRAETRAPGL